MTNSLYGNFRQVKFTDVFPDVQVFLSLYSDNGGIPAKFSSQDTAKTLYYLLYARYGNSVIASSDTNQFKFKLLSIIYSYGPAWEKRLEIQDKLRALTEDEITTGNTTIMNHAYNPSTAPSTTSLEELTYINEQDTNKSKRSKMDAYSFLWDLLDTDVTTEFLNRFSALFLKVVQPELPLWYETIIDDEEVVDND